MENKNLIIILLVIIVILIAAIGIMFFNSAVAKEPTKIKITSNSTITEGESLKIKLTDANGTAIANQTVNVTITDNDKSSDYHSVVTNEKGVGKLKMDKDAGKYKITVTYDGDDKYTGCNATKKITVAEEAADESTTGNEQISSSEPSSSSSESEDDGYWETSPDADFEYHTEYDSSGGFRQYDHAGNLVGSSYDEDQDDIADYVPRRI